MNIKEILRKAAEETKKRKDKERMEKLLEYNRIYPELKLVRKCAE